MKKNEYDKKSLMMRLSPNLRLALNHGVLEMKMKPRIIFDYELMYLEKGKLTIRIEEKNYTLLPGDIVLFKPGKEHEFLGSDGESWMPHIHFDVLPYEDFEEVPINFKGPKECSEQERRIIRSDVLGTVLNIPDVIRIGNHVEIYKTLVQLISAYEGRDPDFPLLQKSLTLRIIYFILKGLDAQENSQLNCIKKRWKIQLHTSWKTTIKIST
jgi:hypothetical protein